MVNKLSDLAEFLHNDSLPIWLQSEIENQRADIVDALDKGEEYVISGPNGEQIKISPKPLAA